jgi:hypothetical protein
MSIINALPGITPTARPYSMGEWPQRRMKMRNGRAVRWGLSSIPSGDRMELVWENITYTQAELLSSVWDANYGIYGELTLAPSKVLAAANGKAIVTQDGKALLTSGGTLAGTDGGLRELLALPFPGATWHFVGNPRVTAVKAGRCTMQMPIGVRGFARYDE